MNVSINNKQNLHSLVRYKKLDMPKWDTNLPRKPTARYKHLSVTKERSKIPEVHSKS